MDNDQIFVQRVTPGDGERLRSIRLEALLDAPSAFGKTHDEESAYPNQYWIDAARERSSGALSSNFLAHQGDSAVGLVGGFVADPARPVAELVSMWVRTTHRGSIAATALVDAVVSWARDTELEAVELWVTRGNDSAIALYERCGFAPTGEYAPLPSDPCKDELRMRLPFA